MDRPAALCLEVARLTGKNAQRVIRELGERINEAANPPTGAETPPTQPSPDVA